jgi:hypothetical protein
MPMVPLGIGAYRRKNSFQPDVEMLNLLIEKDESGASPDGIMRIGRPGYDLSHSYSDAITGLFQQDRVFLGSLFVISGKQLYRNRVAIGGVGIAPAAFAPSVDLIGIVTEPSFFIYDGASLVNTAIPDGNIPIDIDQLNSYLIIACQSGRFYWLEPGQKVFDPLNFATAESAPDGLIAVSRLVDELWFFGVQSIEVWQATGDVNAPFQRAGGRQYERGCLFRDTVKRFDNAIVWVGDDNIVYRTGNSPIDIGSPWLSEQIGKRTGDLSALVFGFDDHKLYVLRIPGQGSFAYDASTQEWSEFQSFGKKEWLPHVACELGGSTLFGDSQSGAIWAMRTDLATDNGIAIERRVSASIALQGKPARTPNISLGIGASANCTVNIRWKDARDDYPEFYEEINILAPADIANVFRCGQAQQPFRTFEVMVDDPALVRISSMMVGESFA